MKPLRAVALLLFMGLTFGQRAGAQWQAAGVFAGASSAGQAYGSNGSSNTDRKGYTAGLALRTRIRNVGPIMINLLVSKKGFDVSQPTIHMTYLEVPVVYSIDLARQQARVQPYFGLGAAFARLLSCRRNSVFASGPYEDNCGRAQVQNLQLDGVSGWDFGLDFRFGFRARLGSGGVVLEARHARGMVSVEPGSSTRNRMLALTLGYEWRRKAAAATSAHTGLGGRS